MGNTTWERIRLTIHAAGMATDLRIKGISPAATGTFFRLLPYFAYGGLPADFKILERFTHPAPKGAQLRKLWPEIEPLLERRDTHWTLKPLDWLLIELEFEVGERRPIRHHFGRLLAFWGSRCVYCEARDVDLHIDHIAPFARGGTDDLTNLTIACVKCNTAKGRQTAAEFGRADIQERASKIR